LQGWFVSTRTFLGAINASFHVPTIVLPRRLRIHDCILMDDLLQNDFPPRSVRKINLCRLCLQVESLAEICNPTTGDCILVSAWKGEPTSSKSK
jgi:hypothetical protein